MCSPYCVALGGRRRNRVYATRPAVYSLKELEEFEPSFERVEQDEDDRNYIEQARMAERRRLEISRDRVGMWRRRLVELSEYVLPDRDSPEQRDRRRRVQSVNGSLALAVAEQTRCESCARHDVLGALRLRVQFARGLCREFDNSVTSGLVKDIFGNTDLESGTRMVYDTAARRVALCQALETTKLALERVSGCLARTAEFHAKYDKAAVEAGIV